MHTQGARSKPKKRSARPKKPSGRKKNGYGKKRRSGCREKPRSKRPGKLRKLKRRGTRRNWQR